LWERARRRSQPLRLASGRGTAGRSPARPPHHPPLRVGPLPCVGVQLRHVEPCLAGIGTGAGRTIGPEIEDDVLRGVVPWPSSDGEIYTVLKRGLPPPMMPGFDGAVSDENLWSIVHYLRTLTPTK
jgi:hypothetical protein